MSRYNIVVGGGISYLVAMIDRKSPGAAIKAWFRGSRKSPLDVGLSAYDEEGDFDLDAYRKFWHWIWNNNDAVREAERAAACYPDYPYMYDHVSREAIEKAEWIRGYSDERMVKEYEWSGYGPFSRG